MNSRNPYQAPEQIVASDLAAQARRDQRFPLRWKLILRGTLWPVALSLPIASFIALIYRFPVPFVGYVSGVDAMGVAWLGMLFYGVLLGGYVLVSSTGALVAWLIQIRWSGRSPRFLSAATFLGSVLVSVFYVVSLVCLEVFIGPW